MGERGPVGLPGITGLAVRDVMVWRKLTHILTWMDVCVAVARVILESPVFLDPLV